MKKLQRAGKSRKFFSIAAASLFFASALLTSAPANATLLCGYINNNNLSGERLVESTRAIDARAVSRSDSFPVDLQGSWQCVTVVVDSLVNTVPVGQKVVSQVDFVRADDGRVLAHFQQPGWSEAQSSVTAFSSTQYVMDKTNYYYGDRMNGTWAARSRDSYQLLESNRMIAESEVDQYIGGHYAGRYRTRSTMIRTSNVMHDVALQPGPDPDDHSGDIKPGF